MHEDKSHVVIILEYCENETLDKYLGQKKRFTEMEAKKILLQILHGLAAIHSKGIIHRDLKP